MKKAFGFTLTLVALLVICDSSFADCPAQHEVFGEIPPTTILLGGSSLERFEFQNQSPDAIAFQCVPGVAFDVPDCTSSCETCVVEPDERFFIQAEGCLDGSEIPWSLAAKEQSGTLTLKCNVTSNCEDEENCTTTRSSRCVLALLFFAFVGFSKIRAA